MKLDLQKTYIMGVSGGCDSIALLHMYRHNNIIVVHINYHMRLQAEVESVYVKWLCGRYGLPFYRFDAPRFTRGNFEDQARAFRYQAFVDIAKKHDAAGILVAHHLDDALETYCMQKEKNIVPSHYGLVEEGDYQGVPILRPLLTLRKNDLKAYCLDHQLLYFEDESNRDSQYRRNAIRKRLQSLSTIDYEKLVLAYEKDKKALCDKQAKACELLEEDGIRFDRYTKAKDDVRYLALHTYVFKTFHKHFALRYIQDIDKAMHKDKDVYIKLKDKEGVVIDGLFRFITPSKPYQFTLTKGMVGSFGCVDVRASGDALHGVFVKEEEWPIVIRNVQEGDSIAMRFGHKAVARFFVDRHIPKWQRARWPIVLNRFGKVILVPGLGCARDAYASNLNLFVYVSTSKASGMV